MNRGIVAAGLLLVGFFAGWLASPAIQFSFPENSVAVIRTALAQPDRLVRQRDLTRALDAMGREDLEPVRALYKEVIAGIGECEVRPFLDAWARYDGPGALEIAMEDWRSFPTKRELGIETALAAWAYQEPAL